MPIKATRALLSAALDGSLNKVKFRKDANFGFEVPVEVPGVDATLLDPRRPGPTRPPMTRRPQSWSRCSRTTSASICRMSTPT
jgi:hypothetical protein